MYIDQKDLQKRKAEEEALLLQSILVPIEPRKKFWQRFRDWLGITKKENSSEVEEYEDRYGTFQSVGLILTVVGIIFLVSQINFDVSIPKINLPSWASDLFSSLWFWIILVILLLLTMFRKKVPGNFSWKWLWSIPILIVGAWLLWLLYSTVIVPWRVSKYAESHPTHSTIPYSPPSRKISSSTPSEKYLNLSEENKMKKGERLLFKQDLGSLLEFAPKEVGTVVYTITKAENETRTWKVEVTKCSNGSIITNRLTELEPYDAAKRGVSYISLNKDATIVVVSK